MAIWVPFQVRIPHAEPQQHDSSEAGAERLVGGGRGGQEGPRRGRRRRGAAPGREEAQADLDRRPGEAFLGGLLCGAAAAVRRKDRGHRRQARAEEERGPGLVLQPAAKAKENEVCRPGRRWRQRQRRRRQRRRPLRKRPSPRLEPDQRQQRQRRQRRRRRREQRLRDLGRRGGSCSSGANSGGGRCVLQQRPPGGVQQPRPRQRLPQRLQLQPGAAAAPPPPPPRPLPGDGEGVPGRRLLLLPGAVQRPGNCSRLGQD